MPVIVHTTSSRVSGLWGRAYIRDKATGKMRPIEMDELVVRGDVILTEQNAIVRPEHVRGADVASAGRRRRSRQGDCGGRTRRP